jgi:uncharacterized protein (DUF1697 family)
VTTRVAFLRAVNLGKRTVGMAQLAEVFERAGYENVWTFINSGNVVFDASGSRAQLERAIEPRLEKEFGFEVTTFVRSAGELRKVLADTPFRVASGDTHFVTFLKAAPSAGARRALEAVSNDYDTLVVRGRDVHWRMHGLSSASPLKKKDWENVLGTNSSTSRNVNSLRKLVAKLSAK